ncbi:MAG: phosphate butyryltransferase [Synergistaceae bacterium]|jgi:phosphate butyryltransferase|nr:phosphate butyryltransferase [Synergistaceae bacterium]
MEYKNFGEVVKKAQGIPRRRGIVAGGEDEHVLDAVFEAQREGIAFPLLAGDKTKILSLVKSLGFDAADCEIIDVPGGENPARRAVEVIAEGKADFLIKGRLDTKDLLKPVVDRKNGLHLDRPNAKGLMSHMAFFQIPKERKLISITDGGMVVYPDLEMKKGIIVNALETLGKMGYENPKVAVLCAVEKLNEKMQETVDAHQLAEANARGEMRAGPQMQWSCVVEGPISYDVAMRAEIAELKGYQSPHCGNFDVLVVPNMAAGNLLGKSLTISAGAQMAGIVVGAKIPIVVTSRGSTAEEKFNSIALCAVTSQDRI